MDGTLANSESYYIKNTVDCFAERGIVKTFEDVRDSIVGITMENTYEYAAEVLGTDVEEAQRIYDTYFLKHPMHYIDYLYPESLEVIKTLKERGYKLALCTMNLKECLDDFLTAGFDGLFDYMICFEDGIIEKPDPDVYLKAMKALGFGPDEVIVVEDSVSGVKAGKASGAYTIGCREAGLGIDLSMADKVIDNLIELI